MNIKYRFLLGILSIVLMIGGKEILEYTQGDFINMGTLVLSLGFIGWIIVCFYPSDDDDLTLTK